jgi:hypothetical protein
MNGCGDSAGEGALYSSVNTGLTECSGEADCGGVGAADEAGEGAADAGQDGAADGTTEATGGSAGDGIAEANGESAANGSAVGDAEQDFAGELTELTPLSYFIDCAGLGMGLSK